MADPTFHGQARGDRKGGVQVDQIYAALCHDIAFGRLMPRQRLVENELCLRFGVTHHHVRQVLTMLEKAGLAEKQMNKGCVVKAYTARELQDLYEVRAILQGEAARRIPLPADPQLIARLEEINAIYEERSMAGDFEAASESNDAFHRAMFEACGNKELADLIELYWLRSVAIHSRAINDGGLSASSRDDHRIMIDAMRRGDRDLLVRTAVEHIRPAFEAYRGLYGLK